MTEANNVQPEQAVDEAVAAEATEQQEAATEEVVELSVEEKLTAERDEWKDKSYRLAAEMENVKRRTQKEIEDARKYGVTSFARELLEVQDNLERAITVLNDSGVEADKLAPMVEGVDMVRTQLTKAFTRVNIERIECMGEKLNPELHQAVMQIPSEEEAGTVVQEMQAGYTIAGRLLRPSMVGVATKG